MYSKVEEYKEILKSGEQQYDVYIILEDGTKVDSDISGFKPIYNLGEKIIGNFATKRVEFSLFNTSKYNITNQEFEVFIGLKVNNVFNYISLGKFIADKPQIKDEAQDECSIVAHNYTLKFKIPYKPILTFPCTIKEAIKAICNYLNIGYVENNFINLDYVLQEFFIDENATFFDVIKVLVEAGFANADINNTNSLIVKSPSQTIDYTFSLNELFELKKEDNKFGPVNSIVASRIIADDGSTTEDVFARDETSITKNGLYEYKINQNDAIDYDRQTAVNNMLAGILNFEYVPATIEATYNPAIEVGDILEVPDVKSDTSFLLFAKEINIDLATGLMIIESTEKTQTQTDYNAATEKDKRRKTEAKVNKLEGQITLVVKEQTSQSTQINNVASNLNTFINETYSNDISNLQDQIDGAIQFWNGEAIPTLSNYPANEWTTEEQRNNHRADIYTVIEDVDGEMKQGKSYRFDKVGTTWQWVELTDNELSAVQALASSKAKVYVTTPTVPYNVGDLWLKDEELYECITAKDATGSYSASDWVKATKYTDDTKANEVADGLAQTNTKVSTIEQNLDGITERVEATETGIRENTQSINQLENEILLTDTFERQKDFQIDAAENILTDVKVYGELEQDTKVSSNILKSFGAGETDYFSSLTNVYTSDTNYYKAEPLADSWIHIECDVTGLESGSKYINHFIPPNKIPKLKTSTTYTIIYEFRNVNITTMSSHLSTLRTQGTTYDNYFSGIQTITNANIQKYNNSMYKITKATLSEFSGNIALRNFQNVNAGDKFSYDYRISVLEGDKLSEDYTYEQYANRPSSDEEARINTAGYFLNLFDNSVGGAAGEFLDVNGNVATGNENLRYTDYIKLPFDAKKLAVSGMTTGLNAPAICFYNKDKKFISGVNYASAGTKIIDVPKNSYFFRTSYRTINTKFQIEKGVIIHDYIEPNTRGIFYDNIGKNFFDFSKTTEPYSTVTVLNKEKNTFQIKGSTNTYRYHRVLLKVKAGTYTFQRKWKLISGDNTNGMTGVVLINQGFNGPQLLHLSKTVNSKSFTVIEDCELDIIFYISGNVALTSETEIQFYDIQLEKGTKATEPEIYKENHSAIILPENEFMGKIDTYEDYIEGNILHKKIGKLVLDGTETIETTTVLTNTTRFSMLNLIDDFKWTNKEISTHFKYIYDYSTDENHFYMAESSKRLYLFIDKTIASTADELKNYLAEQYANGTPVTFYYVLAEEYTKQIDRYTLPTMKGINNISVSAPLSATYYTNVDINSALTSKAEYAEQVIKADEISTRLSSTETTIANQSVDISSINDNIGSLNNSVSANQQEITVIKEDYTDLRQTVEGFDFTVVDRIQQQIANGEITSNVVKTTTVAIDADGVKVAKSGSEMQSLLDNEGVYVNKGAIDKTEAKNNTLTVDKDGIVANNLWVRTYLTAGYHRTEGYIENGKKRTGTFYQGGVDD